MGGRGGLNREFAEDTSWYAPIKNKQRTALPVRCSAMLKMKHENYSKRGFPFRTCGNRKENCGNELL